MSARRAAGEPEPLYSLRGRVAHGKGKGRAAGMPTANMAPDADCQLPPLGVYASVTRVGGAAYRGVTNVGYRPSVDAEERVTVETYIMDFSGDIYGERVALELYGYLRPTRKFASLGEVARQVAEDCEAARELLAELGAGRK